MTEHPILFNGPMVRANREGRETQTRCIAGLSKINAEPDAWKYHGFAQWSGATEPGHVFTRTDLDHGISLQCPYGVAGDRLWTRETWAPFDFSEEHRPSDMHPQRVVYLADQKVKLDGDTYRPSIHMPRWASRDTYTVVSARPERLHCITKTDALSEGIQVLPLQSGDDPSAWYQSAPGVHQCRTAIDSFRQLWDSTTKTLPWSKNPWVWRIEYR